MLRVLQVGRLSGDNLLTCDLHECMQEEPGLQALAENGGRGSCRHGFMRGYGRYDRTRRHATCMICMQDRTKHFNVEHWVALLRACNLLGEHTGVLCD